MNLLWHAAMPAKMLILKNKLKNFVKETPFNLTAETIESFIKKNSNGIVCQYT